MKILQVTPRYPPHTGGVETHVKEISERLVERGHDVAVLSADAESTLPRRERRNGVRVRRVKSVAPGRAYHFAPGIIAGVKEADVDVVHAHNYHSFPQLLAALSVTSERFVVAPHYHGRSETAVRNRLLGLYRPVGAWSLRRADVVLAVSKWERSQLGSDFGVEATVVPNGLNDERFSNPEPVKKSRPYLLCVGRLKRYKGMQYALRALIELPEYDLFIAGTGPFRDKLQSIAKEANLSERVEFLGYVPDEQLPGLYAGADVFLALSKFEAYGMTVAEALAAGTPCVVRETGALCDWVSSEGVIGVSSVDRQTVARAVLRCQDLAVTAEIPSWDRIVQQLEQVYTGCRASGPLA